MAFRRQPRAFPLALLLAVGFLTIMPRLWAQAPAAETVQQRNGIPGLPTRTADLPVASQNLGEIKVVEEYPKPEMLTLTTSQEFFYTDNVLYTHHDPQGSSGYEGSTTASLVPYSVRDWTPRISAQYNMYRYDTVPTGDFDNEQLALSSTYMFGSDRSWTWAAVADLSRYTATHQDGREYYREVVYDNQVRHVAQLRGDTPLFLILTYDVAYHQASPDAIDYLSNGLDVALAYSPTNTVTIAPYLNPCVRNFLTNAYMEREQITYYQHDRIDLHLAAGLDVTWQPCPYMALETSIYHVNDYSNNSGLSFNYTIPGITLTGEVRF